MSVAAGDVRRFTLPVSVPGVGGGALVMRGGERGGGGCRAGASSGGPSTTTTAAAAGAAAVVDTGGTDKGGLLPLTGLRGVGGGSAVGGGETTARNDGVGSAAIWGDSDGMVVVVVIFVVVVIGRSSPMRFTVGVVVAMTVVAPFPPSFVVAVEGVERVVGRMTRGRLGGGNRNLDLVGAVAQDEGVVVAVEGLGLFSVPS